MYKAAPYALSEESQKTWTWKLPLEVASHRGIITWDNEVKVDTQAYHRAPMSEGKSSFKSVPYTKCPGIASSRQQTQESIIQVHHRN
jgi:hypothetical protein